MMKLQCAAAAAAAALTLLFAPLLLSSTCGEAQQHMKHHALKQHWG
jgi:hypothetical protein